MTDPAAGSGAAAGGLPPLTQPDLPTPDPPSLHRLLAPFAAYVGTWRGVGRVEYPTIEPAWYGQQITLDHDGRPFLRYASRSWVLDDGRPLACESGFWRAVPPETGDPAAWPSGTRLEVLLAHASGVTEVLVAAPTAEGFEMASDIVARTTSAKPVTATRRLYGVAEGTLVYVLEMAAMGQPMTPHLSARLLRVVGGNDRPAATGP